MSETKNWPNTRPLVCPVTPPTAPASPVKALLPRCASVADSGGSGTTRPSADRGGMRAGLNLASTMT